MSRAKAKSDFKYSEIEDQHVMVPMYGDDFKNTVMARSVLLKERKEKIELREEAKNVVKNFDNELNFLDDKIESMEIDKVLPGRWEYDTAKKRKRLVATDTSREARESEIELDWIPMSDEDMQTQVEDYLPETKSDRDVFKETVEHR